MKKSFLITALASFAFFTSAQAQKSDSALQRLGNVLQNARSYNKCAITVTASTMNFGDGEFGRGVIPTLEITFKGPNDYEMKVVTADAKSFMNRGNFYDAQTNQSRKDIVTEVIEAYALDSDYSLPNKLILKHDGTGKILALDYFKAQAYMDGKGPSYSGNFLRCNEK